MRSGAKWFVRGIFYVALSAAMASSASSQPRVRDRISRPIRSTEVTRLPGSVPPMARPEFDEGSVDDALPMERVTMSFKLTQAQQDDLEALLKQQTDPDSPNYHKWLTPEQYADRFGISQTDMDKVKKWLQSQGLRVVDVAPSRTWIAFNGTARQMSSVFQTQIHRYRVQGKEHYSNATDPVIPSALSEVVLGVRSLDDFRLKPKASVRLRPQFTSNLSGNHFLAPDDLATIYNLTGLYNSGIDGTGQKLVVVGQTNVDLTDIATFRSLSGLPANPPQMTLIDGSSDPGIVADDIGEADLDLEWAGAVARNATILYVYGTNVMDALQFAVDRNLAPVISISYGLCESQYSSANRSSLAALAQRANAQGITIVAASGDSGAADCDYSSGTTKVTTATHGLAVDLPAALPYVTGVGGTTLTESSSGTYWSSTNTSANASAISYIPEVAWNDTVASVQNGGGLSSGGGGKSDYFAKPTWQTGTGVPSENFRAVPDVSFHASNAHDGYLVCTRTSSAGTWSPTCVNGFRLANNNLTVYGGTSAGAPVFAGIVTLLNQKTGSSQGNINPQLYSLAASSGSAFHDVTSGDNKVPCTTGTPDCPAGTTSIGYSAGVGYDMATGLGSVDGTTLASHFGASSPDFQLASSPTSLSLSRGGSSTASITLTGTNGFSGTPAWTCSVASALSGTTCSVAADATNPYKATLTVTAPSQTASLHAPGGSVGFVWWSAGLALGGVFLNVWPGKRDIRRNASVWMCLVFCGVLFVAAGCGGGGSSSSSRGTSTSTSSSSSSTTLSGNVTVQATSGSLSHTVQVAVTVN